MPNIRELRNGILRREGLPTLATTIATERIPTTQNYYNHSEEELRERIIREQEEITERLIREQIEDRELDLETPTRRDIEEQREREEIRRTRARIEQELRNQAIRQIPRIPEETRTNNMKILKPGQKVKIIANTAGHGFIIGKIVTFRCYTNGCGEEEKPAILIKEGNYYLAAKDYKPVETGYQPIGIWA